jgi:cytochrome c551/c552
MKDCAEEPKLAEQNRAVGAQRGADTTRPEVPLGALKLATPAATPKADAPQCRQQGGDGPDAKNGCLVCHGVDKKIVGPAFTDVAKKHADKADYLAKKIKSGGSGIWGPIPMPAQALSEAEARTIAAWLASGAGK